MDEKFSHGGTRIPNPGNELGRPRGIMRPKVSVNLAPETKPLAQKIQKELGYKGWGYVIDEAVEKLEADSIELEMLWLFVKLVAIEDECLCGNPPYDNGNQCNVCCAYGLLQTANRFDGVVKQREVFQGKRAEEKLNADSKRAK